MLTLLVAIASAQAGGMFGLDWVPFGRADQAWVSEEQLSGTQVAETDGLLQPPVTAWGGWTGKRNAVIGGLAAARISSNVQTHSQVEHSSRSAFRPSLDYRRALKDRVVGAAVPYVQLGGYGVIPSAQERSDTASKSEQKVLNEQAQQDRSRIGGFGLRGGLGAEIPWESGLLLGARYSVVYHRSRALDEETLTVSSLLRTEAALVLGFAL